jgi:hypothetical protein
MHVFITNYKTSFSIFITLPKEIKYFWKSKSGFFVSTLYTFAVLSFYTLFRILCNQLIQYLCCYFKIKNSVKLYIF